MDFESVADELFSAPRERFTALRDERARQARPDRALAKKISGLRKPTVAAWLVDQVSRTAPEEIDRLARLGESLRRAHQNLAGAELRELSHERHEVVDMLSRRAEWLARKAGYRYGDDAARQVEATFEAMVSDARAAEAVRAGRLSAALTPGASEEWFTATVTPEKAPRKPAKKTEPKARPEPEPRERPEPKRPAAKPGRPKAPEPRKPDTTKARREVKEATRTRDRAQRALAEAERSADAAAATVADLRRRLAEAVELERGKRAEVTAARRELTAAERAARAAEKRLGERSPR
ncbi:hypothetical protein [Amycolatopsis pigmentata]|uniref:Uncharacterized protein n=1 Tax=Amycolatopsis pigmentata TaxID=450801 RepID=A0ABW5G248_9PSEU